MTSLPRIALFTQSAESVVRNHVSAIAAADVEVSWQVADDVAGLVHALDGAESICITDGQISDQVVTIIKSAPDLRWLQIASSGYERAERNGLLDLFPAANAPSAAANTVAEHACALLLSVVRGIPHMVRMQDAALWSRTEGSKYLDTLAERRVLILGAGEIGSALARRLRPFDVEVIGVSRSGTAYNDEAFDAVVRVTDLRDQLSRADVLVIALPSTPDSRALLDRAALSRMSEHSIIVNVARGDILPTHLLSEWLHASAGRRVAVDVLETEPPADPQEFAGLDRLLVSPHVAGFGGTASLELARITARNAARFRDGLPLVHAIGRAASPKKLPLDRLENSL